jgi:hypothetical protein
VWPAHDILPHPTVSCTYPVSYSQNSVVYIGTRYVKKAPFRHGRCLFSQQRPAFVVHLRTRPVSCTVNMKLFMLILFWDHEKGAQKS